MKKESLVIPSAKDDWKGFVRMLCKLDVSNTSQEIADVINKNSDIKLSWQKVAGIRASVTKGK